MRLRFSERWNLSDRRAASVAGVIWTALTLAAVVLLSRRLGGFSKFPPSALVAAIAAVSFVLSFAALLIERSRFDRRLQTPFVKIGLVVMTVLPPVVIGLSMSAPEATAGQMAVLTLGLASGVAATVLSSSHERKASNGVLRNESPTNLTESLSPEDHVEQPDQWMSRTELDGGLGETVEGTVTVRFAAGEKTAVVHIAFCPPLPGIPELECEPTDGTQLRWKLAVAQPYGVRIDIRRSGDIDQPQAVPLAWFASASRPQRHAA